MIPVIDRPAALLACGLDACVPDAVLADLLAEQGDGDAATLRRGLALWRARELLIDLAAHPGDDCCPRCRRPFERDRDRDREETWCQQCFAWVSPGPTRLGLAEPLAAALAEAEDPRAERLPDLLAVRDVVDVLACPYRCPRCAAITLESLSSKAGVNRCHGCGWSGPAAALLPPLMSRAELDAAVAARRAACQAGG
jgi:hypothetical protein